MRRLSARIRPPAQQHDSRHPEWALATTASLRRDQGGRTLALSLSALHNGMHTPRWVEDCPLPDPMEFNHNALFHALYAAGLLALAAGVLCDTADSWTAAEKPTDAAKELERV